MRLGRLDWWPCDLNMHSMRIGLNACACQEDRKWSKLAHAGRVGSFSNSSSLLGELIPRSLRSLIHSGDIKHLVY